MANQVGSNPWVIDTVSAVAVATTRMEVRHFEFAGYSVQGSVVTVKDTNGKVIWSATGAADLEEVRSGNIGWVEGLAVTTLDNAGVLRVFFK